MIIYGNSLTEGWLKALREITKSPSVTMSPTVVSFKANIKEDGYQTELESDLNTYLKNIDKNAIDTTASTIFPQSLIGGDGESIYDRFDKIWPYIRKDNKNKYGHYFRRLVAYDEKSGTPINQLQHIIDTYNGKYTNTPVHRKSALIALTFDPTRDHTSQKLRGFPCMQQVCFVPNGNKLTLNAIYAMQYLCERAYGNYIGLQNLGNYMASQMGLELESVNCIASVLKLDMTKSNANKLLEKYTPYVKE